MTYTEKTTENLRRLAALSDERNGITPDMFTEHAVFRGLRDMSGNGVVTGLTEISTIKAKKKAQDGTIHTCPGELYYRGYAKIVCRKRLADFRSRFQSGG